MLNETQISPFLFVFWNYNIVFCISIWVLRLIKFSPRNNSSRPIINNDMPLLIGCLKCIKQIRNSIGKSSTVMRPISNSVASTTNKICRIWGSKSPRVIVENPRDTQHVAVWSNCFHWTVLFWKWGWSNSYGECIASMHVKS